MNKEELKRQLKEINDNIDEAASLLNKAFEKVLKLTQELNKEEEE